MSGHDFWRGTEQLHHLKGKYVTDLLTDEAERLIEAAAENDENPMFMLFSHLAVHSGNPGSFHEYPEEDITRFSYIPDENRRKYAGDRQFNFFTKTVHAFITIKAVKWQFESTLLVKI